MKLVADFETTTDETDCRVWGWAAIGIEDETNYRTGINIDSFMKRMERDKEVTAVYFHNLKFDGEFILNWLFESGYKHSTDRQILPGQFSTLISDMGQFYSIKANMNNHLVTFLDSLKIIPLSVDAIPKAFGLEEAKGEIDYTRHRDAGYMPTDDEWSYIRHDVSIVRGALKQIFDSGLHKMTQAGNALQSYRETVGKKAFERWFPALDADKWLRRSYKGGFTYADPRTQGREVGEGSVYDVNSLYPFVMYTYPLPHGHCIWFDGEYMQDKDFPLYIVGLTCQFELKQDMLPTIQLKHHMRFSDTEYLRNSDGEDVTLILTSVDMELFFEHYNVYNIEWLGGYKFQQSTEMFRSYIDKWTEVKTQATVTGNKGQRTMAKLMLNALYGKFGTNPRAVSKTPRWNDAERMIHYVDGAEEIRKALYVPVAAFVTAYARRETIRAAQRNYSRFMYADTDSLHLLGVSDAEGVVVDSVQLGAWKKEKVFKRARFIRAKTYIEDVIEMDGKRLPEAELEITCAGMPKRCHGYVTFDNFVPGLEVPGKLQHKRVRGGVVLKEIPFSVKGVQ